MAIVIRGDGSASVSQRLIDRRGESAIPSDDIGHIVRVDQNVTLPAASFGGTALTIDLISDSTGALTVSGAGGVAVNGVTTIPSLLAATAVLLANNTWRVFGAS